MYGGISIQITFMYYVVTPSQQLNDICIDSYIDRCIDSFVLTDVSTACIVLMVFG